MRRNKKVIRQACAAIMFAGTMTFGGWAQAVPVLNPANNHSYDVIQANLNWAGALAGAAGLSHLGQSGYLATITSAAEKAFLDINFGNMDAWIGANDIAVEGTWIWATGPEIGTQFWQGGTGGVTTAPFNYANWTPSGEPNDFNGEDCAHIRSDPANTWNDLPCSRTKPAYVVEFNPPGQSVPEPTTILLLGLGLAGLGFARQRLH